MIADITSGLLSNLTNSIIGNQYQSVSNPLWLKSIEPLTVIDIDPRLEGSWDADNEVWSSPSNPSIEFERAFKKSDTYLPILEGINGSYTAYWQMLSASVNLASEGNSYFKSSVSGASLPSYLRDIGKAQEGKITLIWDAFITGTHKTAWCGNNGASSSTAGIWIDIAGSSPYNMTIQARNASGSTVFNITQALGATPYDKHSIIIVSLDKTTSQVNYKIWVDGSLIGDSFVIYSLTDTDDPAGAFRWFGENDTQRNYPPVGSIVYGCGVIEDAIDTDRAVAITNHYRDRAEII